MHALGVSKEAPSRLFHVQKKFNSDIFSFSAENYLDIRLIQLLNVLKDFISKHIYIVSFNYLEINYISSNTV